VRIGTSSRTVLISNKSTIQGGELPRRFGSSVAISK
jgi:hypothetical protein